MWLSGLRTQHSVHEDVDSTPGLTQWGKFLACRKLGHRPQMPLNLLLPWRWRRPMATALIGPLAWELPYATSEAVKKKYIYIYLKKFFKEKLTQKWHRC